MSESQNLNQPNTRLIITKMVLENFKSYAGVQEIGPFHKRFSSVVGPNGSGKSNVIDAMLFVFGKRANQLRLNNVSELIHKSSRFPDLEYATVSVYFELIEDDENSSDDYKVIPGSAMVVTRTAYKNNTSKYSIDGKKTTYAEVGLLLRSHGIDLDNNRFLILQGEVEQIAMMKPKGQTPHEDGLLEYLEDIIGSNRYLEQINEISKSLDALNDKRIEKVNRMKIAQKDRDNLTDAKEEAQQYLDKEKEIKIRNNILLQFNIMSANEKIEATEEKKNNLTEKLNNETNQLKEHEERLVEIEKSYETTKFEYDRINEEVAKTTEEFQSFERRDVKMHEDMKHYNAQRKKLQAAIDKDAQKESEALEEQKSAEGKLGGIRDSIAQLKEQKLTEEAKIDEIMIEMNSTTSELRAQLEHKQGSLIVAQRSVADLQTECEALVTSINLVKNRSTTATKAYQEIQAKVLELKAEHQFNLNKKTESSQILEESKEAIKQLEVEIASLKQKESDLQSKLRKAVTETEEAKAFMHQSSGRSNTISSILKAAKKGGPLARAGIRGRLGDLGTISNEYDVAISTACPMLDFIVVESSSGGQMVLDYLRQTNLGRVSLIVLDQMDVHAKKMNSGGSFPAQRLFDLITVKSEEYKVCFYFALSDTLVVPDMDTATRVAFEGGKKRKVVTLDGNLIETSGAMSGGGVSKKSGGMKAVSVSSEDVTEAQVKSLEENTNFLQNELTKCRKVLKETEDALAEIIKLGKEQSQVFEKASNALEMITENLSELEARSVQLKNETNLTSEEKTQLKSFEDKTQNIEKEKQRVAPGLKDLEAEVESIQKKIYDVGGPKLKRAQAKVDSLGVELDNLSSLLSKTEVESVTAKKNAAKANTSHSKAVSDLEGISNKLKELSEQQVEMENDALVVIQAVEKAKALLVSQETLLNSNKNEFQQLKDQVSLVSRAEIEIKNSIDDCNRLINENKAKKNHWEKELANLRLKFQEEAQENMKFSESSYKKPATVTATTASDEDNMEIETVEEKIEELPVLSVEDIMSNKNHIDDLVKEIVKLENERDKLKENVNMSALLAYLEKDADYKGRLEELEVVTAERNVVRKSYEDLRRKRLEEFMTGFGSITLKLKEMYQMITLGGDAELELVDSLDPFSEGIVFSVRPPKKSWKNISNLSGGEKTLSSLALVFALHHYKPTPLYVMDEIDAALDFKNVSIVANYIKERTKNAQFVIISLRNNMFELADRLVGIYKTNDATKSVTINPRMFESVVAGGAPPSKTNINETAEVKKDSVTLTDCTNVSNNKNNAATLKEKPQGQTTLRKTGISLW